MMASQQKENALNFVLVDNQKSLTEALVVIKSVPENEFLAVDCEGRKLGREGTLDILSIATKEKAFLIDVHILGQSAFDSGIKAILESSAVPKLLFDCRSDSDALKHLYNVHLDGVVDVQLLEVLHRRKLNGWKPFDTSNRSRSDFCHQMMRSVGCVNGYKKCLQLYCDKSKVMTDVKNMVTNQWTANPSIWSERPLPTLLLTYCAVDTLGMFEMYERLMNPSFYARLKVASSRYADYKRSMAECSRGSRYAEHGFLPHNIIPDDDSCTFPYATVSCSGCKHMFPGDELGTVNFCRVCRKVNQAQRTKRLR